LMAIGLGRLKMAIWLDIKAAIIVVVWVAIDASSMISDRLNAAHTSKGDEMMRWCRV